MADRENPSWVTTEQRERLSADKAGGWGAEWAPYLAERLDASLSGWTDLADEDLVGWLDARLDTITLDWVRAGQRGRLDELQATRGPWRDWLAEELDERWRDWLDAQPDALTSWLDNDLLPELFPSAAPEQTVEDLAWVTGEQRTRLDAITDPRGHWTGWLPDQLTTWWPEWTTATPEALAPFLDDWLPTLGKPPATTVADLAWVTGDQRTQLDDLTDPRGHWTIWLPDQLTTWWPEWTTTTPDALVPFLNDWLPTLRPREAGADIAQLPDEVIAKVDKEAINPAIDDLRADADAIAEQFGVSKQELLATLDRMAALPPRDLLRQVAAKAGR